MSLWRHLIQDMDIWIRLDRLDYDWIDMITRYKRTVNPEDFLGSVIAPLYMFDNIQTMLVSKSQTVLTTMALQ